MDVGKLSMGCFIYSHHPCALLLKNEELGGHHDFVAEMFFSVPYLGY